MTRIDKVLKKLSDLYEFNRRIKAYQLREKRRANKSLKEDAAKDRRVPLGVMREENTMPTISMFFGIIIRMYFAPGEHSPPHFHAYYNEYKATVDIRTCEVLTGDLPKRQARLVLAWTELHQDELMANWKLVMNGEDPFKIQPLQ